MFCTKYLLCIYRSVCVICCDRISGCLLDHQYTNPVSARWSSSQVSFRLDCHPSKLWRGIQLDAALGGLQRRVWKHHFHLLAWLGETPSSDQFWALPAESGDVVAGQRPLVFHGILDFPRRQRSEQVSAGNIRFQRRWSDRKHRREQRDDVYNDWSRQRSERARQLHNHSIWRLVVQRLPTVLPRLQLFVSHGRRSAAL